MAICVARSQQSGNVLIIALATLLIIAALSAGVLSVLAGSGDSRADRLHAERAFHAVESGIRRANAGESFAAGEAVPIGGSWFRADGGFCPPERDGFVGWSGAQQLDNAFAVHALCAQLAEGGTGNAGAGDDPDQVIEAPGAISRTLPGNSTRENTRFSAGGSVSLLATGAPGQSRTLRDVTIEAGGAVTLSLGNNPVIDNVFISSGGPVSIDFGGGSGSISCLLVQASGGLIFPGNTPQAGVEYFTDPAAWEAAGCGSVGGGGGSANWIYAD